MVSIKAFQNVQHIEPWGEWVARAEDQTWVSSCQPVRYRIWGYGQHSFAETEELNMKPNSYAKGVNQRTKNLKPKTKVIHCKHRTETNKGFVV